MIQLAESLTAMSIAALFPAAMLYIANVFRSGRRLALVAHGVTLAAWVLLVSGLVIRVIGDGLPVFASGLQALIALSCVILLAHLIQAFWKNLPAFGAVAVPLALVALFMATAVPAGNTEYRQDVLTSHWLYLHVLSIIISMALLLLAGTCAVLWLIQHKLLKAKRWSGAFQRFPPLETLDSLSYLFATVGFGALSIGLITAFVWTLTHQDSSAMHTTLTRVTAAISWGLYAVYLWAYSRPKWRGRKSHYLLVAGCIAILLTTSFHRFFFQEASMLPDVGISVETLNVLMGGDR